MCISSRVHCYVAGLDMTEDWISQHHKVCSRVWFQMVFVTANICENGLAHFYGHVFLLLPLIQLAVCKLTFALLTIILIYINMFSTCHRQWPTGCLSRYCALPVDIFIWKFLKFFNSFFIVWSQPRYSLQATASIFDGTKVSLNCMFCKVHIWCVARSTFAMMSLIYFWLG